MPHFSVAPIEALGIDPVQLTHAAGEIGLRGINQEMDVIIHQAVDVTAPPEAGHHRGQGGQKHLAVLIVANGSLTCIPARGDAIERTREFNTERTSHGLSCITLTSYFKM